MRYTKRINATIAMLRADYGLGRNDARQIVHDARDAGCALVRHSSVAPWVSMATTVKEVELSDL